MPNQSKSLKTYTRFKSTSHKNPAFYAGGNTSYVSRIKADLNLYPHDPGEFHKKDRLALTKYATFANNGSNLTAPATLQPLRRKRRVKPSGTADFVDSNRLI